jgi:3-deoxy-D-manno-octulosonate 8-phosphate phosphatase (KDO 8-P phosphatase)
MTADLSKIKLVVLDVDGTLTDGGIYTGNDALEFKKFDAKDGLGIVAAQSVGLEFMILTGRTSNIVQKRADELNIKYVFQAIKKKGDYLKNFAEQQCLLPENIAYMGDDLNDLPAMRYVGISACPIDAVVEVKNTCNLIMKCKGGKGAVREFVEILLKAKNLWNTALNNF